jgi:hypothetical protein
MDMPLVFFAFDNALHALSKLNRVGVSLDLWTQRKVDLQQGKELQIFFGRRKNLIFFPRGMTKLILFPLLDNSF